MSQEDREFEIRRNIERFAALLNREDEPGKKRTLKQLLREERAKLTRQLMRERCPD